MTLGITRATMMSARWIEVLTDMLAIVTQLATFVNMHTVLANRETLDRAANLDRAGSRGLFENNFSIDFFI